MKRAAVTTVFVKVLAPDAREFIEELWKIEYTYKNNIAGEVFKSNLYSLACAEEWIQKTNTCPSCRKEITVNDLSASVPIQR